VTLQQIQKVERRRKIPPNGPMCDILWADPSPLDGKHPSKRGISIEFGPDVSKKFLTQNNLELLVRSHQTKDEGYEIERGDQVITVFSAPNYCDQMKNKGAYILFKENMVPDFRKFDAVVRLISPIPMCRACSMRRILTSCLDKFVSAE
jgi:serine/threonine-protein phosphatase 5